MSKQARIWDTHAYTVHRDHCFVRPRTQFTPSPFRPTFQSHTFPVFGCGMFLSTAFICNIRAPTTNKQTKSPNNVSGHQKIKQLCTRNSPAGRCGRAQRVSVEISINRVVCVCVRCCCCKAMSCAALALYAYVCSS